MANIPKQILRSLAHTTTNTQYMYYDRLLQRAHWIAHVCAWKVFKVEIISYIIGKSQIKTKMSVAMAAILHTKEIGMSRFLACLLARCARDYGIEIS